MKKVMCFGTFDVVHKGHEYYLRESKKLGDFLVVVVAHDETVEKVKKKKPLYGAEQRAAHVSQLGVADSVVIGNPGDKMSIVLEENPDVICLGYDQSSFTESLKGKLEEQGLKAKIVRIGSYKPETYKSTRLKAFTT